VDIKGPFVRLKTGTTYDEVRTRSGERVSLPELWRILVLANGKSMASRCGHPLRARSGEEPGLDPG
jgi:hypothetical protein